MTRKVSHLDSRFFLFLTARLSSSVGASLARVAVPLAIFDQTESASLTSAVTVVMLSPLLVFGLPAGAVADRASRLRLMRTMELVSFSVLLLLLLLLMLFGSQPPVLLSAMAVVATAAVFFDASSFGFLPRLVGRENLGKANSYLYGGNTVISLIGPAIGALLYSSFGLASVLAINAGTYLTALLFLNLVRIPGIRETKQPSARPSLIRDMIEGVAVIWTATILRHLVFVGLSNAIAGGALLAALVVISNERFSSSGVSVGIILSLMGAGAVTGSLVLGKMSGRFAQSRITIVCVPLGIIFYLCAMAASSLAAFCVAAFLWELIYAMLIINNISLRQSLLPDSLQSRVNSTARTLSWGGEPLGAAIVAVVLTFASYQVALVLCILPLIAASLLLLKSPLRNSDVSVHAIQDVSVSEAN